LSRERDRRKQALERERKALERQTATGEILASMSGSMTDTKSVFDTILRNLLRLFGTGYAVVPLRRGQAFDAGRLQRRTGPQAPARGYPMPVDRDTIVSEVLIARQVRKYGGSRKRPCGRSGPPRG
jgi:hypothetical protein